VPCISLVEIKNDLDHKIMQMQDESRLYYLFGPEYQTWKCSDDSYYSFITPMIIIDKIIELSKEHFLGLDDKVIWDMFAGIGCDGLRFAKHTGKVIMTEVRPDTYQDLKQNTVASGLSNVEIYNRDCCTTDIPCNIIYFDPPWGDSFQSGEPFCFDNVLLPNGKPILELAKELAKHHCLIIKSPISSDSFEDLFPTQVTEVFTFTQQKLKFLFVTNP